MTNQKPDDASKDLGMAVFCGLAALNIVPGTARLGALFFTGYSIYTLSRDEQEQYNDYFTARVTRFPFYCVNELRKLISLPKQPIWIGVALLVTAIALYKLPAFIHYTLKGE